MAREWNVTTEELRKSATLIQQRTDTYNTEWKNLYNELESMSGNQWSGVANEEFNNRLNGFRNDFEDMSKVLTSYVEYLNAAASNYEKTEEAIKTAASNLSSGN